MRIVRDLYLLMDTGARTTRAGQEGFLAVLAVW